MTIKALVSNYDQEHVIWQFNCIEFVKRCSNTSAWFNVGSSQEHVTVLNHTSGLIRDLFCDWRKDEPPDFPSGCSRYIQFSVDQ